MRLTSVFGGLALAVGAVLVPNLSVPAGAQTSAATTRPGARGYWEVAADGGVFAFGSAVYHGSLPSEHITPDKPVVGMAADKATGGYWLVAADGGVFSFDAPYYGSMGGKHLDSPIVGMAATPTGGGYWLVAADGGVFAFGDAHFYGSMGGKHLGAPVSGMSPTPNGKGYDLVAKDGGVFAFGDGPFHGSCVTTGSERGRWIGIAVTSTQGSARYWLAASNGHVDENGTGCTNASSPYCWKAAVTRLTFVGLAPTDPTTPPHGFQPSSKTYWVVASNGQVCTSTPRGPTGFGTMGGKRLNAPMVGMAPAPTT